MQTTVVFIPAYDEALTLMEEARDYMRGAEPWDRSYLTPNNGLRVSCEALRVTSRLTQVMAWLMVQRAVQQGELGLQEALEEHNRLSGAEVCLDERYSGEVCLPTRLRSLLNRSLSLYQRVSRLERQILERTLN